MLFWRTRYYYYKRVIWSAGRYMVYVFLAGKIALWSAGRYRVYVILAGKIVLWSAGRYRVYVILAGKIALWSAGRCSALISAWFGYVLEVSRDFNLKKRNTIKNVISKADIKTWKLLTWSVHNVWRHTIGMCASSISA